MQLLKIWGGMRTKVAHGVAAGAVVLGAIGEGSAQELRPAVIWTAVGESAWGTGSNWDSGATPGEDDIASVRSGGMAVIGNAAGTVGDLSIGGMVKIDAGGSLAVSSATVVGANGHLALNGGSLSTGTFASVGTIAAGASPVSVSGLASIGGTIDLPASANLAFGSSWDIVTAESIVGSPEAFTVGGAAPTLPRGLSLQFGVTDAGSGVTGGVSVGSAPFLTIDRVTGNAKIQNVAGGPVEIAGYEISSRSGLLARRGWNSLDDQNVPNWDELSNTESLVAEYNLAQATTLGVGQSFDLGAAYAGIVAPAPTPAREDIVFNYLFADGRVFEGNVEYVGPPNDLILNIDPETGSATLQQFSTLIGDLNLASYSILSPSGALLSDGFTGLGASDGWTNANPQSTALAELNLQSSKSFPAGTTASIGTIFDITGAQDLALQYTTAEGFVRFGTVQYGDGELPPPPPSLQGDIDGDGSVGFADFLVLSANFGNVGGAAQGDIDGDGNVGFADFLILSANFGNSASAVASVPEPATGILAVCGFAGLLAARRRSRMPAQLLSVLLLVAVLGVSASTAMAAEFDTRFIRLHPEGPNNTINNTQELLGILNGTVVDIIKNEDLTGTLDIIDLAGGTGSFQSDAPYLNGVFDQTMSNFLQVVSATMQIPAGTWTVGFASDDGGFLRLNGASFTATAGEEGPGLLVANDGEILYNGTRGHAWTTGTFTAPAGGLTVGFEAGFFEQGGGDSFEVAIISEAASVEDLIAFGLELEDGAEGWTIVDGPAPGTGSSVVGDIDGNGIVNDADEVIIDRNYGSALAGDLNGDGIINLHDVSVFRAAYAAAQPAGAASGAAVPEPAGASLIVLGVTGLLALRRRRASCPASL